MNRRRSVAPRSMRRAPSTWPTGTTAESGKSSDPGSSRPLSAGETPPAPVEKRISAGARRRAGPIRESVRNCRRAVNVQARRVFPHAVRLELRRAVRCTWIVCAGTDRDRQSGKSLHCGGVQNSQADTRWSAAYRRRDVLMRFFGRWRTGPCRKIGTGSLRGRRRLGRQSLYRGYLSRLNSRGRDADADWPGSGNDTWE